MTAACHVAELAIAVHGGDDGRVAEVVDGHVLDTGLEQRRVGASVQPVVGEHDVVLVQAVGLIHGATKHLQGTVGHSAGCQRSSERGLDLCSSSVRRDAFGRDGFVREHHRQRVLAAQRARRDGAAGGDLLDGCLAVAVGAGGHLGGGMNQGRRVHSQLRQVTCGGVERDGVAAEGHVAVCLCGDTHKTQQRRVDALHCRQHRVRRWHTVVEVHGDGAGVALHDEPQRAVGGIRAQHLHFQTAETRGGRLRCECAALAVIDVHLVARHWRTLVVSRHRPTERHDSVAIGWASHAGHGVTDGRSRSVRRVGVDDIKCGLQGPRAGADGIQSRDSEPIAASRHDLRAVQCEPCRVGHAGAIVHTAPLAAGPGVHVQLVAGDGRATGFQRVLPRQRDGRGGRSHTHRRVGRHGDLVRGCQRLRASERTVAEAHGAVGRHADVVRRACDEVGHGVGVRRTTRQVRDGVRVVAVHTDGAAGALRRLLHDNGRHVGGVATHQQRGVGHQLIHVAAGAHVSAVNDTAAVEGDAPQVAIGLHQAIHLHAADVRQRLQRRLHVHAGRVVAKWSRRQRAAEGQGEGPTQRRGAVLHGRHHDVGVEAGQPGTVAHHQRHVARRRRELARVGQERHTPHVATLRRGAAALNIHGADVVQCLQAGLQSRRSSVVGDSLGGVPTQRQREAARDLVASHGRSTVRAAAITGRHAVGAHVHGTVVASQVRVVHHKRGHVGVEVEGDRPHVPTGGVYNAARHCDSASGDGGQRLQRQHELGVGRIVGHVHGR